MKRNHVFEADDGTRFETAAECKQYEKGGQLLDLLSGLDPEDVKGALDRTSPDLANAIELAGNIIAKKRREDGELRRVVKQSGL